MSKFQTSNWADEIEDEDDDIISAPQEVIVKDGERMVSEIIVDPDSGKKKKIIKTFKLEKKLGQWKWNRMNLLGYFSFHLLGTQSWN